MWLQHAFHAACTATGGAVNQTSPGRVDSIWVSTYQREVEVEMEEEAEGREGGDEGGCRFLATGGFMCLLLTAPHIFIVLRSIKVDLSLWFLNAYPCRRRW